MPNFCMVVKCGSVASRDPDIRFFRIPSILTTGRKVCKLSEERRKKWIKALRREDLTETKIKYGRICSRHFHSGKPANLTDKTHPDWVPTKNMGYTSILSAKNLNRYHRSKAREERKENIVPTLGVNTGSGINSNVEIEESNSEHVPKLSYEELEFALRKANEEIYKLREQLKKYKMEEEYFANNDDDVLYYSGFPEYTYLKSILNVIEPYLPQTATLSAFHQLLLTLMKLRLDLQFSLLAKLFQCHRTTVSRTFERVIEILYYKFKNFIYWPMREELHLNMPTSFKNVFNLKTTVIIDAFEVFIEKPSSPDTAAKTWSQYKHHHTIKFLIGIAPHGCILFISNAYGGRASDRFVTEDSGFLEKLIPGDLVLADKGFDNIKDSVNIYCAEVKMPTFVKGKRQLAPIDIEKTRNLASVRIHVERVIGLLKGKYKIFTGIFPLVILKKGGNEYALIDMIIVVCSVFINLCPSIVPLD